MSTRLGTAWDEVDERVGDSPLELLAVSQIHGVVPRSQIVDSPPRADDFSKYKVCCPGDLVLNRFNAYRGALGVVPVAGMVSPDYLVVRPRETAEARYLDYLLRSHYASSEMMKHMGGIGGNDPDTSGFSRIDVRALNRMEVPEWTAAEQRAIADYLDRETARIDTLIEEQQRLIEMLRERRRSVASDLLGARVGRGMRLKWFFDELDRRAGVEADTLPLMSVSISWGVRRRDEVIQDESRAESFSSYKICRRGDLVINRMRAFQGALGLAQEDGLVSPDYAVIRARTEVDREWLAAVMKSDAFVSEMKQRVKGIGSTDLGSARTPRINMSDLGEIRIDLPEIEQQVSEVGQLQAQTATIDTLLAETERFIELALERRAALITAAVTGQIDVRGMV